MPREPGGSGCLAVYIRYWVYGRQPPSPSMPRQLEDKNLLLFAAVPVVFFVSQFLQAILRQKMISKLLEKDWPQNESCLRRRHSRLLAMVAAYAVSYYFFGLWQNNMLAWHTL